jgi:ferredoxin
MMTEPDDFKMRQGGVLRAEELLTLARACGADDAGLASIDDPALAEERPYVLNAFPATRALLVLVTRMNREPVRSPARSAANLEFHNAGHEVDEIARRIVRRLEDAGVRAINPAMAFPMEMDKFPERGWVVSHKRVAEAAGLGRMGIHRSLIHPKFGSFVLLGTVLIANEADSYGKALDDNPCIECKLCVAACPVGAIKPDGYFDFSACLTHNYQQFMGGFVDFVEDIAGARSVADYREKQTYAETVTRWQKIEPVYVSKGTDAASHVARRFPHKIIRMVRPAGRATSIKNFLSGLQLSFQPGKAAGMDAVYHFTFTGAQAAEATIIIKNNRLNVLDGHHGTPNLAMIADGKTWIRFLNKEVSILRCLLTRAVRLKGPPKLLLAFGKCFPA